MFQTYVHRSYRLAAVLAILYLIAATTFSLPSTHQSHAYPALADGGSSQNIGGPGSKS
jgi:hypothetical protein